MIKVKIELVKQNKKIHKKLGLLVKGESKTFHLEESEVKDLKAQGYKVTKIRAKGD